jgi:hypothetical protein
MQGSIDRWTKGRTSMRLRTALTRHLPTTARFGAVGAVLATRLAVGPLMGETTGPTAITPDTLATGTTAMAQAAPATSQLTPLPVTAQQSHLPLTGEQVHNAQQIVKAAQKMGLPPRAAVIAVATSMQESKLHNLGNLGATNDHDSLGLFQQRPTSGWGTPQQITNPQHSATSFLTGLQQVDGWQQMPLTQAAQKVQVSAYPDAYAQWETQAAHIVHDTYTK